MKILLKNLNLKRNQEKNLKGKKMKIDVYSTNTCPSCITLKQWLTRLKIPFINHDVSVDREAAQYLVSHYGRSVPVIEIDGEGVVGFQQEKIQKMILRSLR